MGEIRNSYKVLVGKHRRKRSYLRPTCRWEDNIKMILIKQDVRCGLESAGQEQVPVVGVQDNELSVSIKDGEFLDQLRNYHIFKLDPLHGFTTQHKNHTAKFPF
jgi:hypothetical protein